MMSRGISFQTRCGSTHPEIIKPVVGLSATAPGINVFDTGTADRNRAFVEIYKLRETDGSYQHKKDPYRP